jgi:hypothetical protein
MKIFGRSIVFWIVIAAVVYVAWRVVASRSASTGVSGTTVKKAAKPKATASG